MSQTLTLAQTSHLKKQTAYFEHEINDLVKSASEVIAPLGPIYSFAARHPWMGLEYQSFEQVARQFESTCDVDIYPNRFMIQTALNKGDISLRLLEISFKQWLESQSLKLSREAAEQFCRNALLKNDPSVELLDSPEVKAITKRLSQFKIQGTQKRTVLTYSQRLERLGHKEVVNELNRHIIKWCKLFLDESQAVWSMPYRDKGFYRAWQRLVQLDPALKRDVRKQLIDLPNVPKYALCKVLTELNIPYPEIKGYLESHLLALPGWAGTMLWRSQQYIQGSSLLIEYLAVRIAMEWVLTKPYLPLSEKKFSEQGHLELLVASCVEWGDLPLSTWLQSPYTELKSRLTLAHRFDRIVRKRLWLEAWEKTYEEQLIKIISPKPYAGTENEQAALAQFVFCIDTRSEAFRRGLEELGPFETFGTAGFFGLPIESSELGSQHSHNSLPIMFKPKFKVKELSPEHEIDSYLQRKYAANLLSCTFHAMKHNLMASLLLPEISGPWLGLKTLARSFAPRKVGYLFHKFREAWLQKPCSELSLDLVSDSDTEIPIGFSEKEKIYYVRQSLKVMGLTDHFAPLVVICGHASHSTNNPYASSLDCGACGGASSGFNARVLATLCNSQQVQRALMAEGISIPNDTVFVAAEHNTSLDELHWIYVPELSKAAQGAFNQAQAIIPKVCKGVSTERVQQLSSTRLHCKNPNVEARCRAEDWSEVRPEWGLARNASFIIGKRELTQRCNLDGRVFLQTYNWKKDPDGTLLSSIITGPGTVAQWINLQYYASTVAPHYYGSGNKATQTVTAGLGVMQGNASDLLPGLPWQSVMKSDGEVYHEPLRLLVVVQAPREYIKKLLDHVPEFRQKVCNGWIRLASIDSDGEWTSWS